jgi:hypothetical protein
MSEKELYPEYGFNSQERLTSTKLNSILRIIEELRSDKGPYSIRLLSATGASWQPTTTGMFIEFLDNPSGVGGVEYNNLVTNKLETLRRFKVEYSNLSTSGFVRFADVQFVRESVDGTNRWVASLGPHNANGMTLGITPGSGYSSLNMTSIVGSSLKCYKDWDSLPIWNGHKHCIVFSTDDGNAENYSGYYPIFKYHDLKYTLFINTTRLDIAGKMSWDQVREMHSSGFEIANHTIDHIPVEEWFTDTYVPWHPKSHLNASGNTLIFMLEADAISGLSNGTAVSNWDDSISSYDFDIATAALKPIYYTTGGTNSMPYVRFDGIDDGLNGAITSAASSNYSFFMAFNQIATGVFKDQYIFDVQTGRCNFATSRTGHSGWAMHITGTTIYITGAQKVGPQIASFICNSGGTYALDAATSGTYIYRDGILMTSYAIMHKFAVGGTVGIGSDYNVASGTSLSGSVMEVICVSGNVTDSDRRKFEGYLAHKWGIREELPGYHRYKCVPPAMPTFGVKLLLDQMYGNKNALEHNINFTGASLNYGYKNFRVKTHAWAGGGKYMTDNFGISMVTLGHIGSRMTGQGSQSVTGNRSYGARQNTWWDFRPFVVPIWASITSFITGASQPTGHTVTSFKIILDTIAATSNYSYKNNLAHFYWHTTGSAEWVSTGHLDMMLHTAMNHSGDFWITTSKDAIEYWRRAHPKAVYETDLKSWL